MRVGFIIVVAVAVVAASSASAVASPRWSDDPVLRDVERAYGILRDDRPAAASRARALLAHAAAALDDLNDPRDSLAAAVGGDDAAPWRGLPHERVMVLLTLAALDVDAGRCDLALPTLKNARHHRDQASLQRGEVVVEDDLLLAEVLRARCAFNGGVGDVDAARAALRARPDGERLLAATIAPALRLSFTGRAPSVKAGGAHGEAGLLVWPAGSAPAFEITIGRASKQTPSAAATSSLVVYDLRNEARPPGPAATQRRAAQASKNHAVQHQARHYEGRGQQMANQARDVRGAVAAGLFLAAATGLAATAVVVDTRVDTRTVLSMPAALAVRTE